MSYREIPPDKILKFPATPAFKGRKDFFTEDSTTHPAKMNLRLLSWILETYTKPGDVVLDPMAGTGSTIVLAALAGRHAIAVEYEPRFCEMIRANIKRTKIQSSLMIQGRMICIQGDARELSKLLKESDAIITSPPYADSVKRGDEGPTASGKDNPTYDERITDSKVYSNDPSNIGNLKHGDIDSIVTSPPYEGILGHSKVDLEKEASAMETDTRPDTKHRHTPGRMRAIKAMVEGYPDSEGNIGNLKGESYLEAMFQVYRECYKVLNPKGTMVLVTKNFIRDMKVVRLDLDTIKLCEAAGFTLKDRWYFKLPTKSFWRTLYRRNYPDVPWLEHEDVLIFS